MRRVFTVCLFTFLISLQALGQEPRPKRRVTITLKDEKTMTGYFVRADESGVVVETDDARTTIKLDSVKLIAFGDVPTNSKPSPVGRTDRRNLRVEQYGLTFELTGVRMSGGSVICELRITSTDRDSEMTIMAKISMATFRGCMMKAVVSIGSVQPNSEADRELWFL